MIAIDTNILVRIVTQDDPEQARRAVDLLAGQAVFISKTVMLELEWVLRYSYNLNRSRINETLLKILVTENFTIEHITAVDRALTWHRQGMDFADALHLATSSHADSFASYDRKLLKKASVLESGMHFIEP